MMLCIAGPAAATPGGSGQSSQSGTEITPGDLAGDLLQVVFSRKANADVKDYFDALVAELSVSSAEESVALAAVDSAIGAQGLPPNGLTALQLLRKRLHKLASRHWGNTAALNKPDSDVDVDLSSNGGSDYLR
jgi:hypothetical protein